MSNTRQANLSERILYSSWDACKCLKHFIEFYAYRNLLNLQILSAQAYNAVGLLC